MCPRIASFFPGAFDPHRDRRYERLDAAGIPDEIEG